MNLRSRTPVRQVDVGLSNRISRNMNNSFASPQLSHKGNVHSPQLSFKVGKSVPKSLLQYGGISSRDIEKTKEIKRLTSIVEKSANDLYLMSRYSKFNKPKKQIVVKPENV
jgi:hypothetical protein